MHPRKLSGKSGNTSPETLLSWEFREDMMQKNATKVQDGGQSDTQIVFLS